MGGRIEKMRIRANGVGVTCHCAGGGDDAIVLLHGAGVDSAMLSWGEVIPLLSGRYRVIAPDLPGYGTSDRIDGEYTLAFYTEAVKGVVEAFGGEPGRPGRAILGRRHMPEHGAGLPGARQGPRAGRRVGSVRQAALAPADPLVRPLQDKRQPVRMGGQASVRHQVLPGIQPVRRQVHGGRRPGRRDTGDNPGARRGQAFRVLPTKRDHAHGLATEPIREAPGNRCAHAPRARRARPGGSRGRRHPCRREDPRLRSVPDGGMQALAPEGAPAGVRARPAGVPWEEALTGFLREGKGRPNRGLAPLGTARA